MQFSGQQTGQQTQLIYNLYPVIFLPFERIIAQEKRERLVYKCFSTHSKDIQLKLIRE